MEWDKLTMKEKSAFMKVAVKNGLTDLKEIKDIYKESSEANKFEEGGKIKTRQGYIDDINSWAISNPNRVFDDDFKAQRQYLTEDTWNNVYNNNKDIKLGGKRYNILPEKIRAEIYRENVHRATEEAARKVVPKMAAVASFPFLLEGAASAQAARGAANIAKGAVKAYKGTTKAYNTGTKFLANTVSKVPYVGKPLVKYTPRALTALGTADFLYNQVSGNGVAKTYNHLKDKEYGKALGSGLVDLLDIAGTAGDIYGYYKYAKNSARAKNLLDKARKTSDNAYRKKAAMEDKLKEAVSNYKPMRPAYEVYNENIKNKDFFWDPEAYSLNLYDRIVGPSYHKKDAYEKYFSGKKTPDFNKVFPKSPYKYNTYRDANNNLVIQTDAMPSNFNGGLYTTLGDYSIPSYLNSDKNTKGNIFKTPSTSKIKITTNTNIRDENAYNFYGDSENNPFLTMNDLVNSGKSFDDVFKIQNTVNSNTSIDNIKEELPKLQNALKDNINYIHSKIPGFKPFGSSVGVADAGLPHVTHDIDGFITKSQFEDFKKANPNASIGDRTGQGDTYVWNTKNLNINDANAEPYNVDLNIIDIDKNGHSKGSRAEELYRQFFPNDYQNAFTESIKTGNRLQLKHNGKILTPEELLNKVDMTEKTILDSFVINFNSPNKQKHAGRPLTYLMYADSEKVSNALDALSRYHYGNNAKILNIKDKSMFSDIEKNREFLNKIGIKDFPEDLLKSPEKMENITKYYTLQHTMYNRGIIRDNMPNDDFIGALTNWDYSGRGGTANGVGLNGVLGGDSDYGDIYSSRQINISDINDVKSYDELINTIDYHMGKGTYNIKNKGNNIIYKDANLPLNESSNISGNQLLRVTEDKKGKEYQNALTDFYKETGVPLLANGFNFGNAPYASATFLDNTKHPLLYYKKEKDGLASWKQRMNTLNKLKPKKDPIFPLDKRHYDPYYYEEQKEALEWYLDRLSTMNKKRYKRMVGDIAVEANEARYKYSNAFDRFSNVQDLNIKMQDAKKLNNKIIGTSVTVGSGAGLVKNIIEKKKQKKNKNDKDK